MKKIGKFEIINHGIESEQYFSGCGVAYTEYTDCATGCGDTAHAALEEALESLAQNDWDVEGIENDLSDDVDVCGECDSDACEGCELHFYVSVRVRE